MSTIFFKQDVWKHIPKGKWVDVIEKNLEIRREEKNIHIFFSVVVWY